MKANPLRRWMSLAALCVAAVARPAAATDCAVLLDNTGTLLIVTDRGTLSSFFVHSLPVLSDSFDKPGPEDDEGAVSLSYGEGFSVIASREGVPAGPVARAEGNSSHPTEGVVPTAPCVIRATRGRPPVLLTPPEVYPPLFMVPANSEVVLETRTASADGRLGFLTYFTFVGGTGHLNLNVVVENLSSETVKMHSYKRFADVDLTGQPANAFFVGPGASEVMAMDPDIDPVGGIGGNGFSRLFRMRTGSAGSSARIKSDDQFSGGAYHTPVGNLLEEQRSRSPIFTEDPLQAYQPFSSPGATRRSTGFGEGGDLTIFGDSAYDFEDDRVAIINHHFSAGYVPLAPKGKPGNSKYFSFQYSLE